MRGLLFLRQRTKEAIRRGGDLLNRRVKRWRIGRRGLPESADLSHELQRRGTNLVIGCRTALRA